MRKFKILQVLAVLAISINACNRAFEEGERREPATSLGDPDPAFQDDGLAPDEFHLADRWIIITDNDKDIAAMVNLDQLVAIEPYGPGGSLMHFSGGFKISSAASVTEWGRDYFRGRFGSNYTR